MNFNVVQGGRWKVAERPNPACLYVMGVDTASGKFNANDSVATILNVNTGVQTAWIGGKYNPDVMFAECLKMGKAYYHESRENPCEIIVEKEYHGATIISRLLESKYPNVFYHEYDLTAERGASVNYGWDPRTYRQIAIDWLTEDIGLSISSKPEERRRAIFIKDPETLMQLPWFERNQQTGKFEAKRGKFDDRVSALYIANFGRRLRMGRIFDPVKPIEVRKLTHEDIIIAGEKKLDDRDMGERWGENETDLLEM